MRLRWLLWPATVVGGVLLVRHLARAARPPLPPLQTVTGFDLPRYLGRWYEIARLPVSFEAGCAGVTAEYSLRPDGRMEVLNRCRAPEGPREARGVATVPNPAEPAQLEVSFFWPFAAPYFVLALGEGYTWALVGDPSRRYLWLLSRTPQLDPKVVQGALQVAEAQGFDLAELIYTPQP